MADMNGGLLNSTSLKRLRNWVNTMRASGREITPSMLQAAIEAENASLAGTANQRRGLELESKRLDESTRQFNESQANQKQQFGETLAQREREQEANRRLTEEQLNGNKSQAVAGTVLQGGTLYLIGKQLGLWGGKVDPTTGKEIVPTEGNATSWLNPSKWFEGNTPSNVNAGVDAGTESGFTWDTTTGEPILPEGGAQVTQPLTDLTARPDMVEGGAGMTATPPEGSYYDLNGELVTPTGDTAQTVSGNFSSQTPGDMYSNVQNADYVQAENGMTVDPNTGVVNPKGPYYAEEATVGGGIAAAPGYYPQAPGYNMGSEVTGYGNNAPTAGEMAAREGGTEATTGAKAGSSLPGWVGPMGWIAMAATNRQSADRDRPYTDVNATDKWKRAPVTGVAPALLDKTGLNTSNTISKFVTAPTGVEETIVGKPLSHAVEGTEAALSGDFEKTKEAWADSAADFMAGTVDAPGKVITGVRDAGGTVICTELHRQGFLSETIFENDRKYRGMVPDEVYVGYRILADPVVKVMRRSKLFTRILAPFAVATAREMAHRANRDIEGSLAGGLLLAFFVPVCLWLGSRKSRVLDIGDPVLP